MHSLKKEKINGELFEFFKTLTSFRQLFSSTWSTEIHFFEKSLLSILFEITNLYKLIGIFDYKLKINSNI